MKKVVLCRSNVCVGCVPGTYGRLVRAWQVLTGAWGAGLSSCSTSERGGHVHVVTPCWSYLVPFWGQNGLWAVLLGMSHSYPAGRPGHLDRAPARSTKVEEDVTMTPSSSSNPRELLQLPSLLSLVSFFTCCAEGNQPAFGGLSVEITLCVGVQFGVLMRGSKFSVFLHCHLVPKSQLLLFCYSLKFFTWASQSSNKIQTP